MLLKINHTTEYQYTEPQRMVIQSHRLYPSICSSQKIISWGVSCEKAIFGDYFYDGAGDYLRTLTINEVTDTVKITITGEIKTTDQNGVISFHHDMVQPEVYLRSSEKTFPSESLIEAAKESIKNVDSNILNIAHAMSQYISDTIAYIPGVTDTSYSADEVLKIGKGVCQDQTHCLITLSRINGIPARYVVGYIHTDSSGLEHDSSHAWAELFIEGLGWVGFDPTNQCCPDERYIRIGSGIDALDASLIRGISRGLGSESMVTSVKISGAQQ